MPYSFTEIERKKSQTISFVFVFLVFFYFSVALAVYLIVKFFWLLYPHVQALGSSSPGLSAGTAHAPFRFSVNPFEITVAGFVALVVAWAHWVYTAEHMFARILGVLKAQTLKTADPYHVTFRNILGELSVATGGRKYEGYVIPTTAMNAFALEDFNGNAVIGLTEGLLSRLSRAQIEAVVAHEAAHILRGDSLETTMTISLYRLLQEVLRHYEDILKGTFLGDDDGRTGLSVRAGGAVVYFYVVSFVIIGLLKFTNMVGLILNMFISRQREFRADAVAVRLSRDPVSLAEALYIISHRWRGAGLPGENLDAIFIVSPAFNSVEEQLGLVPDFLATHPPLEQRIGVLLDMAHADVADLEQALKKVRPRRPTAPPTAVTSPPVEKWFVMRNNKWEGPHTLGELSGFDWILPMMMVKKAGSKRVAPANEDPQFRQIFKLQKKDDPAEKRCPRCYVPLAPVGYEGTTILKCPACEGVLVEEADVQRILTRKEVEFGERIKYLADRAVVQKHVRRTPPDNYLYAQDGLVCPRCRHVRARMFRRFYSVLYKVEIDKCQFCGLVWFDKDELEILQYLYENEQRRAGEG